MTRISSFFISKLDIESELYAMTNRIISFLLLPKKLKYILSLSIYIILHIGIGRVSICEHVDIYVVWEWCTVLKVAAAAAVFNDCDSLRSIWIY